MAYVDAVMRAGGIPVMLPLGLSDADLEVVLAQVDGVLLPGGGDVHPKFYQEPLTDLIKRIDVERDRLENGGRAEAVSRKLPLLAICRGVQVLNVALGGTLWADVPSQMPGAMWHDFDETHARNFEAHPVAVTPDSLLEAVLGTRETAVNSLHHQGIKDLAPGLAATAVAPDGLVEAVEIPDHPFAIGVQWHPEWLAADSEPMARLFARFVQAASNNGRS
ncbi:MAG: gamma-glutamyl-gamma-aminobutyrate hydrolase family protein [Chloroflexi bacterium]|nr:gamma-glutamyl-gamma-aminobutyrate hydrolase family protein [Chloroflexota bacterium]